MTHHQVVLIPGDGIGPEVAESVVRILEAAEAPVTRPCAFASKHVPDIEHASNLDVDCEY